jgi:hypothetical protein
VSGYLIGGQELRLVSHIKKDSVRNSLTTPNQHGHISLQDYTVGRSYMFTSSSTKSESKMGGVNISAFT